MKKTAKFFYIIVFLVIFGFLLYQVPPVNRLIQTQVLESDYYYLTDPPTTTTNTSTTDYELLEGYAVTDTSTTETTTLDTDILATDTLLEESTTTETTDTTETTSDETTVSTTGDTITFSTTDTEEGMVDISGGTSTIESSFDSTAVETDTTTDGGTADGGDGGDGAAGAAGTGGTASSFCEEACLECDCQLTKVFDFGAEEGQNIPERADEAVHWEQHPQYAAASLNGGDAPEYQAGYDETDPVDENGSDLAAATPSSVVVFPTHINSAGANPAFPSTTWLGTILLSYFRTNSDASHTFEFIKMEPVRSIPEDGRYTIGFVPPDYGDQGWFIVDYTYADMENWGFTEQDFIDFWPNGTWPELMEIFYGYPLQSPWDVSIPPGERESYRVCNRDMDGDGTRDFRMYTKNDPAFFVHCPTVEEEEPDIEITNTPNTGGTNITVYCGDTNVICGPTGDVTGSAGNFDPDTGGSGINDQTVADSISGLLNDFLLDPNRFDPQTRLEFWFQAFVIWTNTLGNI